jgi:hypothetical protein
MRVGDTTYSFWYNNEIMICLSMRFCTIHYESAIILTCINAPVPKKGCLDIHPSECRIERGRLRSCYALFILMAKNQRSSIYGHARVPATFAL